MKHSTVNSSLKIRSSVLRHSSCLGFRIVTPIFKLVRPSPRSVCRCYFYYSFHLEGNLFRLTQGIRSEFLTEPLSPCPPPDLNYSEF